MLCRSFGFHKDNAPICSTYRCVCAGVYPGAVRPASTPDAATTLQRQQFTTIEPEQLLLHCRWYGAYCLDRFSPAQCFWQILHGALSSGRHFLCMFACLLDTLHAKTVDCPLNRYQGSLLIIILSVFLYNYHKYCKARFSTTPFVPLETATLAPSACVDPLLYVSPPLRHGSTGWWPEHGAAWEGWGAKVYTL